MSFTQISRHISKVRPGEGIYSPVHSLVRRGLGMAGVVMAISLSSCGQSNPQSPGLPELGSPGVAWSVKSPMQKIGYMAAVVHPKVQMLFASPEGGGNEGYTCEDCHGSNAELNDYKMPTDDLYALPRENPVQDALEYDADITAFMQNTLTPEFDQLLNRGAGPKTAVNCFTCHPVDE